MNFRMILKISIKALNRSKVRSVLTMLGIIIGVGSLISMVSLGQGAQMQIQEAIAARGANLLYVRPEAVARAGITAAREPSIRWSPQMPRRFLPSVRRWRWPAPAWESQLR